MEKVYKRLILKFVNHREYKPVNKTDLAKLLDVLPENNLVFRQAFQELLDEKSIVVNSRGFVDLPKISGTVIGTYRSTKRDFGFVVPRDATSSGDLFVPQEKTLDAVDGDTVLVKVIKRGFRAGQKRYGGEILEILERAQTRFTGTLKKVKSVWVVEPDGKGLKGSVIIEDVTAKGGRDGDKVSIDILEYPSGNMPARGVIVEVLGRSGHYDAELKATVVAYDLPGEFDEACMRQAREVGVGFTAEKSENVEDITDRVIVTIDPPDAKDFDDAISLRKTSDGSYILGVHIADVSRFISIDSPLDMESKSRGNSVYLPGKVIPMLPEILSNGVCSLQPGQNRYTKTVYISYDREGKVLGSEFANSIIRSSARLTYIQADDILNGRKCDVAGEVVALLKDMEFLARAIEQRRLKEGMLELSLAETELIMDDQGKVVDAEPAENSYPHKIIEMFMVEANVAVAQMLDRFNVPFMRRIHPDPDTFSMKNLSNFVRICNLRLPRKMDRFSIQQLLGKVKDTSIEFAINNYVLRSLQKAEYSPLNMGHYALASRHYCHFTSPIRRYADLLVHRLVQCYLEQKLSKIGLSEVLTEAELIHVGKHISNTEENAMEAERDLKKVLILQMLSERIGEEMNTVVSGLTKYGVFVQCLKFGIEGMIPIAELGIDEWRYEEKAQAIVGSNSGKKVYLGLPMTVRIVSVNVYGRHLDVAPAEPLATRADYFKRGKKGRRKNRNTQGKKFRNNKGK